MSTEPVIEPVKPTSLKQLVELFRQAASMVDTLPRSIRQFAAYGAVLTNHVRRIEFQQAQLDKTLAEFILASRGETPAAPTSPEVAAKGKPAAPVVQTSEDPEEDEAKALAEQMLRETEAEAAALSSAPSVTPLRKPKPQAEQAS